MGRPGRAIQGKTGRDLLEKLVWPGQFCLNGTLPAINPGALRQTATYMKAYRDLRWTSSDGLSLYARDYSSAEGATRLPVICLHGLTRNSRDFEEVAPRIAAKGRRVLVPDVRGRGRSDWDHRAERYTPETYVADIRGLMDQAGVARAAFVGTSMGGIILMALAAAQPGAVAAAVLNDVGPENAPEGIARIKAYVGGAAHIKSWAEAADYVKTINGVAFPHYVRSDWERFARRLFCEKDGVFQLDYDPAIALQMRDDNYKAEDSTAWQQFQNLVTRRPTLLVRGGLSDLLSQSIAQRMQTCAPDMQFVEVPDVGHAPMLTEPEAAHAIDNFLAGVE